MNSGENSDILDKKTNDKKNVPVLVITYFVVIIFICMFAYIIVFMVGIQEHSSPIHTMGDSLSMRRR